MGFSRSQNAGQNFGSARAAGYDIVIANALYAHPENPTGVVQQVQAYRHGSGTSEGTKESLWEE